MLDKNPRPDPRQNRQFWPGPGAAGGGDFGRGRGRGPGRSLVPGGEDSTVPHPRCGSEIGGWGGVAVGRHGARFRVGRAGAGEPAPGWRGRLE